MCGIIAVLLKNFNKDNDVNTYLINGLKQLQNRGYDSAGICLLKNDELINIKYASTEKINAIDKLEEEIFKSEINSNIGIGHTRWATHGGKTDLNSHPHISNDNKFALVHNGIIENYLELKNNMNHKFYSETDSEVIVNLLCDIYHKLLNGNPDKNKQLLVEDAINETIKLLEGTWALVIICKDTPNVIYGTRRGSPLLLSTTDNLAIFTSEQSGFDNKVNNYIILENNDILSVYIKNDKIQYTNTFNNKYSHKNINYNNFIKLNYEHWTLKEIYEQPESINRAINFGGRILDNHTVKLGGLNDNKEILKKIDNIIILGCGTSYNAGLIGVNYFKELCNFNFVQLFDGAEFEYIDIPRIGNTALILLSQSGETRDIHRCIQIAKENNLFTIGIINVVDSLIAREVNCGCYLNAGKEVGVASTKAFTSQCVVLSLVALWFSQIHDINQIKRNNYIMDLLLLSNQIKNLLDELSDEKLKKSLEIFENKKSCFILGKEKCEAIAKEGALKIKEISYIHSEGYSTSSLKHGPFALLEDKFPVILLAPYNKYISNVNNTYQEISSRYASIIYITDELNYYTEQISKLHNVIYIPKNNTYYEILCNIPLQMIAYKLALKNNINPDMPKNLAKVVTVD